MKKNRWFIPLNMALAFHISVIFCCIYLPQLLHSKPKFPDIYTVNLVNITPEAISSPPPAANSAPVQIKQAAAKARKTAPIAETAEPTTPKKAISIKPLKKKVKRKIVQKPKVDTAKQEKIKKQRLEELKKAQQEAEEAARIAEQEAALAQKMLQQKIAENINSSMNSKKNGTGSSSGSSSTGGSQLSSIQRHYYNAIQIHISNYYQLPEHKKWPNDIFAVAVIKISSSGKLKDYFIEQSSGDRIFDQFVIKSLEAADPVPRIPPAMRKSSFEIGLVFKPSGIGF